MCVGETHKSKRSVDADRNVLVARLRHPSRKIFELDMELDWRVIFRDIINKSELKVSDFSTYSPRKRFISRSFSFNSQLDFEINQAFDL